LLPGGENRAEGLIGERKKINVRDLYRYSDLSVEAMARQVNLEKKDVQKIIDNLIREEAIELVIEQSMTNVEKIMSPVVISLDCSKTPKDAADLMAEKDVGSIVVTKNGKPFGIVTQSDIVRWAGKWSRLLDSRLEDVASKPLITVCRGTSVEGAAQVMISNAIHRLPVVEREELQGIVTITDLAIFLSPARRPGLALSVLQAITRGQK
jgi:CBS domain-containing protein